MVVVLNTAAFFTTPNPGATPSVSSWLPKLLRCGLPGVCAVIAFAGIIIGGMAENDCSLAPLVFFIASFLVFAMTAYISHAYDYKEEEMKAFFFLMLLNVAIGVVLICGSVLQIRLGMASLEAVCPDHVGALMIAAGALHFFHLLLRMGTRLAGMK